METSASSSLREVLEELNGYTPDERLETDLTALGEELTGYLDVREKLLGGLGPKLTSDPLTPKKQRARVTGYLSVAISEARAQKAQDVESKREYTADEIRHRSHVGEYGMPDDDCLLCLPVGVVSRPRPG